ncbi:helix-turn-helix domain-containing protein [Paenarthrobacter sp. PH39-S1]|uniref:winged helix-turn-helix domain-containing protein n=1 Tax=Paenarthrobacter sp. PH39-S1 TaxID=3046204 RepID=UPI0024B97E92|nr:helix-turn-helix domain-containing protein [Paenarthrobacter sp. PH39-S1]MDJ0356641.1 helix-turn-helix domain-containing protein [Paenarthrobacter sp. PH39-S1]
MDGIRPNLTDPAVLDALSHPVRLDVLSYLMSSGPATASECARAVGDTPSNCSYHLRVLASHRLVVAEESGDGRMKPWRATITGFSTDLSDSSPDQAGVDSMLEASLQLDHQLAREHLRTRSSLPHEWTKVDAYATYGLLVTPSELAALIEGMDAVIRPFLAATRTDAPNGAEPAHLSVTAFPRPRFGRS